MLIPKRNPGRPKREGAYRQFTFAITQQSDEAAEYVQGCSRAVGLQRCASKGDAINLCIEQVAAMMKRQQVTGKIIPWEIPKNG